MLNSVERITVRSVSAQSRARLVALRDYSRLTYGSLIDDAVDALWALYVEDDHDLPPLSDQVR